MMQNAAASDLGLHYLPLSLLWDTRDIWVNLAMQADVFGMNMIVR